MTLLQFHVNISHWNKTLDDIWLARNMKSEQELANSEPHSPQNSCWLHSALAVLPLPTGPCIKMQRWCLPLWKAFIIKVPSPAYTLQPVNNMNDVLSTAA